MTTAQTSAARRIDVPAFSKGLDLPIAGAPKSVIEEGPEIGACAAIGPDFPGLKPRMEVEEGDRVELGQPLFADKRHKGVVITSPCAGVVRAVHRGARRVLEAVVVQRDDPRRPIDCEPAIDFSELTRGLAEAPERERLIEALAASGLWASLTTRPYGKIADPRSVPDAVFLTAIDTAPLAPEPALAIAERAEDFAIGARALARLTDGETWLCARAGASLPDVEGVSTARFDGPHPAGLPSTHIHHLRPVGGGRTVVQIHWPEVIAIGALLRTGKLDPRRVIALTGPSVLNPRHVRTFAGADLIDLLEGELDDDPTRVISGDVLAGRRAAGPFGYLGRFDRQVTAMPERAESEVLGWLTPHREKFATARVHLRTMLGIDAPLALDTNMNGSPRAMTPFGLYEDLMPMDILPTQLLRSILVMDTDAAQDLGALELIEEDLALCSYVCHSKYEYGQALRACLDKIEAEG